METIVQNEPPSGPSLCGLWIDSTGIAWQAWRDPEGRDWVDSVRHRPYVWATEAATIPSGVSLEDVSLAGDETYKRLLFFDDLGVYQEFLKENSQSGAIDWIRSLEQQFLLAGKARLFANIGFSEARRLQLDIETSCSVEGGFSEPRRKEDRILAIGLRCGEREELLTLEERNDAGERSLLKQFVERLQDWNPDIIEGHNLFKFDLHYLASRSRRFKVPLAWGRFEQEARFRNSRLRVAERWIDYPRCDLPGREVVDTFLLAQIYDISNRELMAYGLKDVARALGVTAMDGSDRTYIAGDQIQVLFEEDHSRFLDYLSDDLRETKGVAEQLLPTYYEQAKTFPITLQEACLRGTASKVDLVFQEEYFHRKSSCPAPVEVKTFAGGYTESFEEGVFKNVLHYDVASLYPSLLLLIGRNPERDREQVFIPMLRQLREYRLKYKNLARSVEDPSLASEYDARQASFKILINSFYGYLGFSGARFGDAQLAAEVTARGRELLVALIDFFRQEGCRPLEADTDGIYLSAPDYFGRPEALLSLAQKTLPEGIELECDGRYVSMFCYKAKNYALFDGRKVIVRGSALRSRGIEPFLKELTNDLIHFLLGHASEDPADKATQFEQQIGEGSFPIDRLAKSEVLSQNPAAYRKKIEAGGKPRRASAEVALLLGDNVRMGDRVTYYLGPKETGKTADWQRAIPLDQFDPKTKPYDPGPYLKKLKEWRKRYTQFHPKLMEDPDQGNLF